MKRKTLKQTWRRYQIAIFNIIICGFIFVAVPNGYCLESTSITGRYKYTGVKITHRIVIPDGKVGAAIILQYLPPNTVIKKTKPEYNSYDQETGIVKWLYDEIEPGTKKISIWLEQPVDRHSISAEILFKDPTGEKNTFAIRPLPMKRSVIEGC